MQANGYLKRMTMFMRQRECEGCDQICGIACNFPLTSRLPDGTTYCSITHMASKVGTVSSLKGPKCL